MLSQVLLHTRHQSPLRAHAPPNVNRAKVEKTRLSKAMPRLAKISSFLISELVHEGNTLAAKSLCAHWGEEQRTHSSITVGFTHMTTIHPYRRLLLQSLLQARQ